MKSITYGKLPTRQAFQKAFHKECPSGRFAFRNDPYVGTDKLSESQLWDEMKSAVKAWRQGDEEIGDWASCVLSVLGFEWV